MDNEFFEGFEKVAKKKKPFMIQKNRENEVMVKAPKLKQNVSAVKPGVQAKTAAQFNPRELQAFRQRYKKDARKKGGAGAAAGLGAGAAGGYGLGKLVKGLKGKAKPLAIAGGLLGGYAGSKAGKASAKKKIKGEMSNYLNRKAAIRALKQRGYNVKSAGVDFIRGFNSAI